MAVLQAYMQARLVCYMLSFTGTSINNRHLYTYIVYRLQPARLACSCPAGLPTDMPAAPKGLSSSLQSNLYQMYYLATVLYL